MLGDSLRVLGRAYYATAQYALAGERFEAALELASDEPMILYHLATAKYKLGEVGEARQRLQRALEVDSHFEEAAQARTLLLEIQDSASQP